MNESTKSMKASSKVIAVIMKIGYVAAIVGMCICLASLIFVLATGGQTSMVTSGGIRIIAMDAGLTTLQGVVATCGAAFVMCAFLFTVFFLTSRMFSEISETCNPFNPKYVKTIKSVGVLVVVMVVVGNIVDSVAAAYAGVNTIGICSDSTGVIFGVIIYCLAYIFEYGCVLQKQSDETL